MVASSQNRGWILAMSQCDSGTPIQCDLFVTPKVVEWYPTHRTTNLHDKTKSTHLKNYRILNEKLFNLESFWQ